METTSQSLQLNTDQAIQELIKSCRVPLPDESNDQVKSLRSIEVQTACDELLSFKFHSENGRLQVIEELTKLQGNFVVKIIRKGLSSLSKVYSEGKTFEDESLKFVDLCCSQSEALRQASEDGHHVASPASIVDWVVELCDELVQTKEASSTQPTILMSNCLSKFAAMYETVVRARLESSTLASIATFKSLFEILKPRIRLEAFIELLDETAEILKAEEESEGKASLEGNCTRNAPILQKWVSILKFPFITNLFAVETANQDPVLDIKSRLNVVFTVLDELGQSENIGSKVIGFLTNLPGSLQDTLTVWIPLVKELINVLPETWDLQVFDFLKDFLNKLDKSTESSPEDSRDKKMESFKKLLLLLKDLKRTEEDKTKVLHIGLCLFDDFSHAKDLDLALNVVFYLGEDMDINCIRQYATNITKAARSRLEESDYPLVKDIIGLTKLSSIKNKNELFDCCLEVVRGSFEKEILVFFSRILTTFDNEEILKRFYAHAVAGRKKVFEQFFVHIIFNAAKHYPDKKALENHVIFLFNIIDETVGSGIDPFAEDSFKVLFYKSMNFGIIFESLAGSMVVGTYDRNVHGKALEVLFAVIKQPQLHRPIDILSLYIELSDIIRTAKFALCKESVMKYFVSGLALITKLPLTIPQMCRLMHTITKILNDEDFTADQVSHVMVHLYKMPDNFPTSSVDSSALVSHFDKLVQPLLVRELSRIKILEKKPPNSVLSVMELLCEKVPKTFAEGTSVELFRRVVEDCQQNGCRAAFFLSVEMIKQYITDDEFEADIDEILEKINIYAMTPPHRILLYAECLTECCDNKLNDKKRVIIFIRQMIDLLGQHNCCIDDLSKMFDYRLQVPKHLVMTFRDAANLQEARAGMRRILNVVKELEPSILSQKLEGQSEKDSDLGTEMDVFLQHDFAMLLKQDSLTATDISSSLQIYNSSYITGLLTTLSNDKERLQDDTEWSPMYNQSQILTPAKMVYVTSHHLKRFGLEDKNDVMRACSKLFEKYTASKPCKCPPLPNGFQTYFALFVNIMEKSSHHSEIKPWLTLCAHHAIQCHKVVLASCSWKDETKDCEEACQMNDKVLNMITSLLKKRGGSAVNDHLCYNELTPELDLVELIITTNEDMEFTDKLFEMFQIDNYSTSIYLRITTPPWQKEESLLLVETLKGLYPNENSTGDPKKLDEKTKACLEILQFAAKALPNSAEKVRSFLEEIIEKCRQNDSLNLKRIPEWRKKMVNSGYPVLVIESWCTSLVHLRNLSSRDIDAIADLTPDAIDFLSRETKDIAKCLFSEAAPRTWDTGNKQNDQENIKSFKRRLRLAKILHELEIIGIRLKENAKIVEKIKDGVVELCAICSIETSNLYEAQNNILKKLYVSFFEDENRLRNECISQRKYPRRVQERLVTMFRRLARRVKARPVLLGNVKSIVDKIESCCKDYSEDDEVDELHQKDQSAIHEAVLHFESNQDAIHTLQAAGYNQSTSTNEDLWYSSSIEMPTYVTETKAPQEQTRKKLTKIRIIWMNQLLHSVSTCSEQIPGCYAPNGFYSEKPVICGINVDNRIIALYKGNSEMENVEVKLFPTGMVVFGFYRNSHPYDTDPAWAAFYKMLLDKHLVPKIFLTNVSPAFDWIQQILDPEKAPPCQMSFVSCCDLIPSSEDRFDYEPDVEIRTIHTESANSDMKEIIILNQKKAKKLKFREMEPQNRNILIKEQIEEVVLRLKEDDQFKKMHPESLDKMIKRMMTPIRNAVEMSVDGGEPTEESISISINEKKLLPDKSHDEQQNLKKKYSDIIFAAVKKVTADLQGNNNSYNGCEPQALI